MIERRSGGDRRVDPRGSDRRGRPREVIDPVRVCVRVSGEKYDRLDQIARYEALSTPALIRQAISALLKQYDQIP